MTIFCVACNSVELDSFSTDTPSFVTATLPPTSVSEATQTLFLLPTNLVPTNISNPVEGTTTTQINVRASTTTASPSLGLFPAFSKIQIIGKESSENWYKVVYNDSTGWVRAEFVQVESSDNILVVEIDSSSGSNRSGVVISGINVRSGAGTEFESIGVLTPKDVIIILGKDSSGAWMQIKFQGNIGWVSTEFIQIENNEQIPVIEVAQNTPIAPVINETPTLGMLIAITDNDSMQAPYINLFFGEEKIFQITGEVSTPQGDNEDWVEFSSASSKILIEGSCSNTGLQVELWQTGEVVENFSSGCGNYFVLNVSENEIYFFRIFTNDVGFVKYSLKIKVES